MMKNWTKIVTLTILCVSLSNVHAREASLAGKVKPLPKHLFAQRSQFEEQDSFYKTFIAKTDNQVTEMYKSRWWYHETQENYGLTATTDEHINFASTNNFGKGEKESDLRSGLATQVLRMRIDAGIRAALAEVKNPKIQKAQKGIKQAMDTMNNYPLRLSSKPGSRAGEFRLGYDVLSDSSKIEYAQGLVEAGVYHPKFSGLVTQQQSLEIANLSVGTNFGGTAPKATLSMPLHRNSVEASLSKPLSDVVNARLTTGQPLRDQSVAHRYEAQIAYSF